MKRQTYHALILDNDGSELARAIAYAPKTARLASEALLRTIARSEGQTYSRGVATDDGTHRGWQWTGDRTGRKLVTRVVTP